MATLHPDDTPAGPSAAKLRPREAEDWLNRHVYHPPARRLARLLQPTGVSPNMVSVAGGLSIVAAAAAYTLISWPAGVLLGFFLHAFWHVLDGADGELARLTGRSSPTGELVDGVCDYAGHALLYFALALFIFPAVGHWAWVVGWAAGLSHVAQSNHAESQRRTYLWWVYGVPWLKHAQAAGDEVFEHRNWFSLAFAWFARLYLKLAEASDPYAAEVDALIAGAAGDPRRRQLIADLARDNGRVSLLYQKFVGANPRAPILGLAMALGSPLYYFLAECVLLNLLLLASIRHHRSASRRLARQARRALSDADG
jgi:CDP-alcohol phosphatidyltransferase